METIKPRFPPPPCSGDASGNHLPNDFVYNDVSFFVLAGDANHDRTVNLTDLNVLATNFGKSGMTFSQGNFDYSGTVGIADFNLLAGNFGKTLAAPGNSSLSVESIINPAPVMVQAAKSPFADTLIADMSLDVLDTTIDQSHDHLMAVKVMDAAFDRHSGDISMCAQVYCSCNWEAR